MEYARKKYADVPVEPFGPKSRAKWDASQGQRFNLGDIGR
jgi:hypothetical protein